MKSHQDADRFEATAVNRRKFLEAAGFTLSLAAISGCGRAPIQLALPFTNQPEGRTPGRSRIFATTCGGCSAGCGVLVNVRDGRPLKMEGMPEHPLSAGGLCAVGQAQPLGLYDSHRLQQPLDQGKDARWSDVDAAIAKQLSDVGSGGGAIRVVTPTVTSGTLKATIDAFLEPFSDARHLTLDAASCSAILDAHQQTHQLRALPHFRFDQATVIVSFGADFLSTWISPVEFTAAWSKQRAPAGAHPEMSYHVQFESRVSLTGSNADRRFLAAPDQYGAVLSRLAKWVATLAGKKLPEGQTTDHDPNQSVVPAGELAALATRLWEARGNCIVVCDSQLVADQLLVNYLNELLGNYGHTVDLENPSLQRQSHDDEVLTLVEELKQEKISALFVAGTDPVQDLPGGESLAEFIGRVPLVVSLAERVDEFAALAHFVCPDHHPLESWMDAEPVAGVVGIRQPMIAPLGETRSIIESFARWSGREESALDAIQSFWRREVLPRSAFTEFTPFWDRAVHDGFMRVDTDAAVAGDFDESVVTLVEAPPHADEPSIPNDLGLVLYWKTGVTDSRHAHNPWLQELPDPITKTTWDNYVCVSPTMAAELELSDGDVVQVESSASKIGVELPVLIQPGQQDEVLAIALGYGVRGTERFAKVGPQWLEARPTVAAGQRVGRNAAGLIDTQQRSLNYFRRGVRLTKTGRRHDLARTQQYHSLEMPPEVAPYGTERRHAVQQTTLDQFREDPHAGAEQHHHSSGEQLWAEDHPKDRHKWAMTIDLNKCTGCSACLVACQSENNVPVVGKDEVRRQREMHWIRIDRYYSGDDRFEVAHQPMMCQHCDNAPCETVCPVLATVHGEGGLNQQVYNRCVGTRYCANNCPYKVRRFNWFDYPHDDDLQNLALNPDVTVRTRGVMEKCSMCVQRIENEKMEAKRRGEPVADGAVQTACQQSCPAQAIVFGDMNNPKSQVRGSWEDPRRYGVLEELNLRPSVGYLRVVRNRHSEGGEGGGHE